MNILYVISTLNRTGPINVLLNIIKNLDRSIFTIHVLCLSSYRENSIYEELEKLNVNTIFLNLNYIRSIIWGRKKIKKIISKNNIHIIHSHGFRVDYLVSGLNGCFKKLSTLHSYYYEDYLMSFGVILGNIMIFFRNIIYRGFNIPITCSKTISDRLYERNGYRFQFVQNGIDVTKYNVPTAQDKLEIRRLLKLPNKRIFITVSMISKLKNIDEIINVFKQRKNDMLLILGSGPLFNQIKEKASEYDNIYMIGHVTNVSDYLSASDYYISASLSEGLPNSVLEAMASGLPCILSDIKPHKEVLSDLEIGGALFKLNCCGSLNSVIEKTLKKDYALLSKDARKRIEDNFSSLIMTKKYSKIYQSNS